MANVYRGEVDIVVPRRGADGEPTEKTYRLTLSFNACVELERRLGKRMPQILTEAQALDFTVIREIVFALLQKYHAKEFKALPAAGDLIDDAGGPTVFFEKLAELVGVTAG